MSYQEKLMQQAIALSREGKNTEGGGAFGAVITKNNKLVAACHNTVSDSQDPTQHAELKCIQLACKELKTTDLSDCELYTSCVPCMMCLGAIKWAQFEHVYYGASAQMAKEAGYVYSDMYYSRSIAERDREFRMEQQMAQEAKAVWDD